MKRTNNSAISSNQAAQDAAKNASQTMRQGGYVPMEVLDFDATGGGTTGEALGNWDYPGTW